MNPAVERRWWVRGSGYEQFHGDRVSLWEEEEVLEMDGGDGRTVVRMYFMPLSCTLNDGRSGKFEVIYILAQFKEKPAKQR